MGSEVAAWEVLICIGERRLSCKQCMALPVVAVREREEVCDVGCGSRQHVGLRAGG